MSYCYRLRGRDVERLRQQLRLHADDRVVQVGEEVGHREAPGLRSDLETQIHCIQKLFESTRKLRGTRWIALLDAIRGHDLRTFRITSTIPVLTRRRIKQPLKRTKRRCSLLELAQASLPTLHVIRICEV